MSTYGEVEKNNIINTVNLDDFKELYAKQFISSCIQNKSLSKSKNANRIDVLLPFYFTEVEAITLSIYQKENYLRIEHSFVINLLKKNNINISDIYNVINNFNLKSKKINFDGNKIFIDLLLSSYNNDIKFELIESVNSIIRIIYILFSLNYNNSIIIDLEDLIDYQLDGYSFREKYVYDIFISKLKNWFDYDPNYKIFYGYSFLSKLKVNISLEEDNLFNVFISSTNTDLLYINFSCTKLEFIINNKSETCTLICYNSNHDSNIKIEISSNECEQNNKENMDIENE